MDELIPHLKAESVTSSRREGSAALLYVMGFLADVAVGIVMVALPYAGMRLGAGVGTVGLIGGVYMGGYGAGCLLGGPFIDRFRPRTALGLGQILQGCAALAMMAAGRRESLIVLVAAFGGLMVAVWPPMMSWLTHGHEGVSLNRRIGRFNVSWCSGLVVGPFIGGLLYDQVGPTAPFIAAAGVLGVSGLLTFFVTEPQPDVIRRRASGPETETPGLAPPPEAAAFRFMGRISVVVCTAITGMQRFQVPALAKTLEIGPSTFGAIMLALSLANMIGFMALGRTHRWHYRLSLLLGAEAVLAAATASLVFARSGWHLAAVAMVTGACASVAYSSSLYYGVSGGRRRGALTAIHEMLLAGGFMIGAIGSGALSQRFELRTPCLVGAAMLGCAVFVQVVVYTAARLRDPRTGTYQPKETHR